MVRLEDMRVYTDDVVVDHSDVDCTLVSWCPYGVCVSMKGLFVSLAPLLSHICTDTRSRCERILSNVVLEKPDYLLGIRTIYQE